MAVPFTLRPYQLPAVDAALTFARVAVPASRLLFSSPTGTGKSYIVLALLDALPTYYLVVPSAAIMRDMLVKAGLLDVGCCDSQQKLYELARAFRIYTPVTLRNGLLNGTIVPPSGLLIDEAHHDSEDGDVYEQLMLMVNGPAIGITATAFRGTPQGTAKFLARWGKPYTVLTVREALDGGFWTLPTCETWPLVNDDLIEVSNGQLVASQVESATDDKIEDLADRMQLAGLWSGQCNTCNGSGMPGGVSGYKCECESYTPLPTIITMPGTKTAERMYDVLSTRGLACNLITQSTSFAARDVAIRNVNTHALIQIRTVGEGCDIHARVMVDAAPTLSPVLWLQRFGRLTRPGGVSRYICTNLNYSRHCYLLEGCAPEAYLADSVKQFGQLSDRSAYRAFGLESLGRLRATRVRTAAGYEVHTYGVTQAVGTERHEYFVIVHPNKPQPFWFRKTSRAEGETMQWGEWEQTAPPSELRGFKSARANTLTDKQKAWWERAAEKHGLDASQEVNARVFSILPILSKHKVRL